jgi:hypothetical protein
MKIARDNLWLCHDCHFAAAGVDETIVNQRQALATEEGLKTLGIHLVPDHDGNTGDGCDEFSRRQCDCCLSSLGGSRHRYAVLAPDSDGSKVAMLVRFETWAQVIDHALRGGRFWYAAPLDAASPNPARAVRVVKVYKNGKLRIDPLRNEAEPFTCDEGHLSRFRRAETR